MAAQIIDVGNLELPWINNELGYGEGITFQVVGKDLFIDFYGSKDDVPAGNPKQSIVTTVAKLEEALEVVV